MKNAKKTVIHIHQLSVAPTFFFIWYPLLFKNFPDLYQILEIKKNFALAKITRNAKDFKMFN